MQKHIFNDAVRGGTIGVILFLFILGSSWALSGVFYPLPENFVILGIVVIVSFAMALLVSPVMPIIFYIERVMAAQLKLTVQSDNLPDVFHALTAYGWISAAILYLVFGVAIGAVVGAISAGKQSKNA